MTKRPRTKRLGPARRMTGRAVLALALPVTLGGAQACDGPTSPDRAADVRISLAVTGGFAGADWQLTIDGASRAIIGDRCRAMINCDWEPGERLGTPAPHAILTLAARFVESGFFQLPRDDYGDECCDQFFYTLTYTDDDDRRTVRGSDGTLPRVAQDLIDEFNGFVAAQREFVAARAGEEGWG